MGKQGEEVGGEEEGEKGRMERMVRRVGGEDRKRGRVCTEV